MDDLSNTINPKRKSIRLSGYDYCQPGAYFITLCSNQMIHLFGKIVDGLMLLNNYGKIIRDEWFKTTSIRRYIQLFEDEFIVMPNHIHGIIWILDGGESSMITGSKPDSGPETGSIGAIIGQYKSITTKRINKLRKISGKSAWQRNYYDHIIRNEIKLDAIRKYIQTNPHNWETDFDVSTHQFLHE